MCARADVFNRFFALFQEGDYFLPTKKVLGPDDGQTAVKLCRFQLHCRMRLKLHNRGFTYTIESNLCYLHGEMTNLQPPPILKI